MVNNRRHAGWSLMHMLVALPLFLVFIILGSKLFLSHTAMLKTAAQQDQAGARMDSAMFHLRADAGSATAAQISDQGSKLTLGESELISQWTIREGTLTRSAQGDPTDLRYQAVGEMRFTQSPGAVVIWIEQISISVPLAPRAKQNHAGDRP